VSGDDPVVPRVHVVDTSSATPEQVLAAARDFSARRAELWRDVHLEHMTIHDRGETWADVTEGNPWPIGLVWERLRYDWSVAGAMKGIVVDSNIFKPGSTWEIHAAPGDGGGSQGTTVFQVAGEGLNVYPGGHQRVHPGGSAPACPRLQVPGVGTHGLPAIAGQVRSYGLIYKRGRRPIR